jgi:hypothetical protein
MPFESRRPIRRIHMRGTESQTLPLCEHALGDLDSLAPKWALVTCEWCLKKIRRNHGPRAGPEWAYRYDDDTP